MRAFSRLIILCGLLAGPAQSEPAPVIYVFDEAFPPFSFVQDGRPQGFEVDVLSHLLAGAGRKLDSKPMHWDAAQAALRSGKADVTSGMAETGSREKVLLFAKVSTFDLLIVIWAPDASTISGPDGLKGQVVATERG